MSTTYSMSATYSDYDVCEHRDGDSVRTYIKTPGGRDIAVATMYMGDTLFACEACGTFFTVTDGTIVEVN